MKWMKHFQYFLTFSLPLCLEFVSISTFAAPIQTQLNPASPIQQLKVWQISQGFKPPKRDLPPASVGGATRGNYCLQKSKQLIPLIPREKLGLTFAERPTFFWYLPAASVKTAQFVLLADQDQSQVYETTLNLPNRSGIIGFRLPESAPTLEVGKRYHWYLALICSEQNPSKNPTSEGWVERTQPELTLSKALAQAELRKRPALYAKAGIWHEALTTFIELRRTEPNNQKIKDDWRKFLQSVGLNGLTTAPLID
ncbi:DUF928 domain-containing protein [Calothrix sp. PCC 7507]|uniref:DUF928 domain-containing protein n=1 Tax=Calothrix sp. PCC 7507 TaxID=99598 RepID=UPI00029F415E|nr:DUF928 domain-containing protein [Calothrix sp. PCC 7507]AFY35341.1 protein of unknown function DUF928 [Calothrix sp. PCC 7507]